MVVSKSLLSPGSVQPYQKDTVFAIIVSNGSIHHPPLLCKKDLHYIFPKGTFETCTKFCNGFLDYQAKVERLGRDRPLERQENGVMLKLLLNSLCS